jgi:hypothetical protein
MIKFDVRYENSNLMDVTLSNGKWVGCIAKQYDGIWVFFQEDGDIPLTGSNLREIADKMDEFNRQIPMTRKTVTHGEDA